MTGLGYATVALAVGVAAYAYLFYPVVLKILAMSRRKDADGTRETMDRPSNEWPRISITVPMFNEEDQAEELLDSLLALEYPADRRQIVVVSDASSDRTDQIVDSYADRGVELIRHSERVGKTEAENRAAEHLTGDIVVNTDASIRIRSDALKLLIAAFSDSRVGLASGRDISVSHAHHKVSLGESGYVGYEMWIRDLETAVSGIVGASGCLYAIRSDLHRIPVPDSLNRDFAAALKCKDFGYRAVSVPEAVCFVPRTASLHQEYRRKVRTMTRGIETLVNSRHLLNPLRHGVFAWMLFSHKICRWMLPWAALLGLFGLVSLVPVARWSVALLGLTAVTLTLGVIGWIRGDGRDLPKVLAVPAYALMGNVAAMHAGLRTLRGKRAPIWEPTRREQAPTASD